MTKKQVLTLARILATVLLTMIAWILPLENRPQYVTLLVFVLPYLIIGYDVIISASLHLLKFRLLNENFLMTAASLFAFSIVQYPAAVAIMLFYQTAELILSIALERKRKNISAMMKICPEHVDVIRSAEIFRVLPNEIAVGETIVIRPGEPVPLDCVITKGSSTLDTGAIMGQSTPRNVEVGDDLLSGCINSGNLLEARVTKIYTQSTLKKIIDIIETQSGKKARIECFVRRFAQIYTPIAVLAALAVFILPCLLWGEWTKWLERTIVMLIVSGIGDLATSVSLSFFGAASCLSRFGIIVRSSAFIEALAKTDSPEHVSASVDFDSQEHGIAVYESTPEKLTKAHKTAHRIVCTVRLTVIAALTARLLILLLGITGTVNVWFAVLISTAVSLLSSLNAMQTLKIK